MTRHFRMTVLAFTLAVQAEAAGFDHSHARLARVLEAHVRDGSVHYAALKTNRAELDAYLQEIGRVQEYQDWSREQKLAFLINTYNAAVLQLIIDHYPLASIKRIGGWFGNPFRIRFVKLWGAEMSLDDIEHGIIRAEFSEPRVHFALVCAARSCPALRAEPYVPERLDEQLDAQGKLFMSDRAKNRVDYKTEVVFLSPIFKWFAEDFGASQAELLRFVSRYWSASVSNFRVKYTSYDWSLNDIVK